MLPAHPVPRASVLFHVFSDMIVPRRIPSILLLVLSYWKDTSFTIPSSPISTPFDISSFSFVLNRQISGLRDEGRNKPASIAAFIAFGCPVEPQSAHKIAG
jgi:hypothetical protein